MSIQSLTLHFTTGTPPNQQLVGSQEIPLESVQQPGSKSVAITDSGILTAFNAQPPGTSCIPSIITTYNYPNLGEGEGTINVSTSSVQNFVPKQITPTLSLGSISDKFANDPPFQLVVTSPSDGIKTYSSSNTNIAEVNSSGLVTLKGIEGTITISISQAASANGVYTAATLSTQLVILPPSVTLAANNVTIQYINTNPLDTEPSFIRADPRNTGSREWFAVVTNASKAQITSYAKSTGSALSAYFTPPEQSSPVPFNNIVTTLMTDMNQLFYYATAFNKDISSWDTANVTNMNDMFHGASAFNQNIGSWNTAKVTSMSSVFKAASAFNQNIGSWNTALVTTMYAMFDSDLAFNNGGSPTINSWNTAKVTNMGGMFYGIYFNQPIGSWNTSLVTNMTGMFQNAYAFNQNIGSWDTSKVTNMTGMFFGAYAFNQNIGSWNTALVTNMTSMFSGAEVFNQNIGSWNTAKVTGMSSMFRDARAFNQNIGSWNTALVTNMSFMFDNAREFNQNIGSWDTALVTDMYSMFASARAFNNGGSPTINSWNTAKVTNMAAMFYNTQAFNQPIGSWNTSKVTTMEVMFNSAIVFNQNISGWDILLVSTRPPPNFSTNSPLIAANVPVWFPITRAANNVTIQYIPTSIATEPRFIQADPRNTGTPEWFAVVTNASKAQITSYANSTGSAVSAYFTPPQQSSPVPFNNIVTTLMTDMNNMFYDVRAFNQNIGSWDTSKVTNMSTMFRDARAFNQNIGSWNTALVTSMRWMFYFASAFNQPIGLWDTSKVTDMDSMFGYASAFNQPIGLWDTSKVTNMEGMFMNASAFNQNISGWNVPLLSQKPAPYFTYNSPITAANVPVWFPFTRAANNVTIQYTSTSIGISQPVFLQADPRNTGSLEWFAVVTNASKAQITSYANNEAAGISYFTRSGQLVPFKNIVTTLMTDMSLMFYNAPAFNQQIDSWDTSKVTNMSQMFNGAIVFNQNIGSWNTALVTNMSSMFNNARAFNQYIDSWNTALVTNMNSMFRDAKAFNQNIGSWNTALVTDMEGMFAGASVFNNGGSPTINSWNTAKVTSMSGMFFGALEFNQPIGSWNTSKVTTMNTMFYTAIVFNQNISGWDITLVSTRPPSNFSTNSPLISANTPDWFPITRAANNVTIQYIPTSIATEPRFIRADPRNTGTPEWFAVVTNASKAQITSYAKNEAAGISYFTTSGQLVPFKNIVTTLMTDMSVMFANSNTFNQDISSWDTAKVTSMANMFTHAQAFNQNIGSWDTSKVTSMGAMFYSASAFNNNGNTSIGSWNTSSVKNMSVMFFYCAFNQNIGSWNTSSVTDMSSMFLGATAFNQPIGSWDTALVTNMSSMFQNASAFNENIGSWDTSKVTNMSTMFRDARAFNQNIGSWNTALVTDMNQLFYNARAFNQNIGSWDTSKVTTMSTMFSFAYAFNQNIGSWNTAKVTNMYGMFQSASVFNQPIGSWDTALVTNMISMFENAYAFNQNISGWDVSLVSTKPPSNFSTNSPLTAANNPNWQNLRNFPDLNKLTTDTSFNLTAPDSNSPGSFTYESSDSSVATISGSMVTIVGEGTTTITATQAPSGNFLIRTITATLTISPPSITRAANNVTIQYIPTSIATEPRFIQADPRNTGSLEWFAVVTNASKAQITSYAKNEAAGISYFTTSGQLVPFNNIVTTLMTDMSLMFQDASAFNQNIGSWDTAKVTNMEGVFYNASEFNENIGSWNTALVTNMSAMFYGASAFNNNGNTSIGSWDTAKVTDMYAMFYGAEDFNQNIGSWDTAKVTSMSYMFQDASAFNNGGNTSIGSWDTALVTNMINMFCGASAFNQNIGSWDTAKVTSMSNMFYGASAFNQNIGSWNTALVTNMNGMFNGATAFNQNISGWDITLVSTKPPPNFSTSSALTAANNPNWQNLRNFPDLNKLTTDTSFNLTAPDSNSPGSFTYESSDSSVATISGSMVTIVGEGTTTITATQAPSENFLIRTITATLTISPPPTPPPSSQLELDSTNETTIRYIAGSSIASEPLFILADPRNTGTPQLFAVVTNASTDQIKSYARNEANGIAYFTQGQPNPVPFSNIVTTLMTDMSNLFNSALSFNEDISSWDTAKVTNMNGMFYNADDFNQPIGSWDTAKVTSMISMFENAYAFNQYLSGWDVSLVSPKPPSGFSSNSPLTGANTPVWFPLITRAANKVTIQYTLTSIGSSEPAFIQADPRNTGSQEWFAVVTNASRNQITSYARNEPGGISYFTTLGQLVPFNNIVTTLMTDMNNMFNDAQTFNQDISSWDTSNVTSMYAMFIFALAFNKNIGAWNTALVTDMDRMFKIASAFNNGGNTSIGSWNTALVTTMYAMFDGATAFNQNISGWDVALTPARPSLSITDFATGSPLALAENSHKLPLFQS